MNLQEIMDEWQKASSCQYARKLWDCLPPLQERIDLMMPYHFHGFRLGNLVPAPYPWLIRDTQEIIRSQWATRETKEMVRNVVKCYSIYLSEKPDMGYVYILRAGPYYKIGRTKTLSRRIKKIALQMPFPVEFYAFFPSFAAKRAERTLHEQFGALRANGEWFVLNQQTDHGHRGLECLSANPFIILEPDWAIGWCDSLEMWLYLMSNIVAYIHNLGTLFGIATPSHNDIGYSNGHTNLS